MFTVEEYKRGLVATGPKFYSRDYTMLRSQYAAPGRAITASELATILRYRNWRPINPAYSRLGKLLSTELGRLPETASRGEYAWWRVLSSERWVGDNCIWTMHEELAQALEELGICGGVDGPAAR